MVVETYFVILILGLALVDTAEADEVYTRERALNTAAVIKLLLGD